MPKTFMLTVEVYCMHHLDIDDLSTSISNGLNNECSEDDIKALSVAELDDLMKAYHDIFS